jgi:hypothetical protein
MESNVNGSRVATLRYALSFVTALAVAIALATTPTFAQVAKPNIMATAARLEGKWEV